MNALVENKYIVGMECGTNFSYVLSDNSAFLSTEYKVLQNQANSCFVRCMKMMYNGKIQLYYLTKGLKSFSTLILSLDADSFLTIVGNLLSDIIEVKSNGFLSCQNVDISFERIYVEPTTYKVSLVYLPLSKRIYDESSAFENDIRTELVKLISDNYALTSAKTLQFSADLSNGVLSIEDLYAHIKDGKNSNNKHINGTSAVTRADLLRITSMDSTSYIEITVYKDEFVIGRKPELCDGVIPFDKMISRSHCKICRKGGRYTITDLWSANGTYVNRVRLQPNQSFLIHDGDIIRLANSEFRVTIG